MPLFVALLFLY